MTPTQREEAQAERRYLQALVASPGWEVMARALSVQEQSLFEKAAKAKDAFEESRALAACFTMKDVGQWPLRRIRELSLMLDAEAVLDLVDKR